MLFASTTKRAGVRDVLHGNLKWVAYNNNDSLYKAIDGGMTDRFIARAKEGFAQLPGVLVAKKDKDKICFVLMDGKVYEKREYEVLCGTTYKWLLSTDGPVHDLAFHAGHDENGDILYVGRAEVDGQWRCGMVEVNFNSLTKSAVDTYLRIPIAAIARKLPNRLQWSGTRLQEL